MKFVAGHYKFKEQELCKFQRDHMKVCSGKSYIGFLEYNLRGDFLE